jgi:hypothetical protein
MLNKMKIITYSEEYYLFSKAFTQEKSTRPENCICIFISCEIINKHLSHCSRTVALQTISSSFIEEHFVNIPNAQMGQLCRSRRERTLQADVHAHNSGSTNYLAEACVLFPQSRASYATRVYNRQPREAGLPSPCLSPTLAELMLTRTRAKYTRHAPAAQHSRAYTSRRPTRERAPR